MNYKKFETPENFPSKEEILNVISEHSEGLETKIKRELSDDTGLYFIEIITTSPDSEGYVREYTYSRKSLKTEDDLPPKVYVAYFQDDMPVGGKDIYEF